ncbi:DgyrCDS12423 [Dimorphilus gyrociliatus]|uniref:DgyrCDS12423 n=1 Tax=Dimorphilus gyrociliatus TaxID=2664684 RepID=A0A7I8W6F0_9ANNE|nr:DgyrCDS12423 [Dimorphilus gyrociliatus]
MRSVKLFIETLTGGKFELTVQPEDTIEMVKNRITKIEGISVPQQQLVHDEMELHDEKRISDYPALFPRAKLRLMVAMRGGPINTRRITVDENAVLARDIGECLDSNEDFLERLERLSGNQLPVTLVVLHDGKHYNLFRIVDKPDSPYSSDSLSATSALADDNDIAESFKLDDENETTKEKVRQLKIQMEKLNLGKANKSIPIHVPRPPSTSSNNNRTNLRTFKNSNTMSSVNHHPTYNNRNVCLPPLHQEMYLPDSKPTSAMSIREGAEGVPPPRSVLEAVREENSSQSRKTSASIFLESLSHQEARGLLRQASIERFGSSYERFGGSNVTFTPMPPSTRLSAQSRSTSEKRLLSSRLRTFSGSQKGRILSPTHRLPPVKQKKKTKRCFVCTKKLGLANSFQCKCNNFFCATHRYAESHSCPFDYKTEGRKLIEKNNPVVTAPKLPKI